MKKKAVVSLGHEALGYTTTEQWDAVKKTAKALADLAEADYQLTITIVIAVELILCHTKSAEYIILDACPCSSKCKLSRNTL